MAVSVASAVIFSFLALLIPCNAHRTARFFAGEYTTTIKQTHVMTSVVPYSCVEVEPSLPMCRSVRNLHGFPTVGGYVVQPTMNASKTPHDPYLKAVPEPEIISTSLGWMQYLGFTGRTVTKVEHLVKTVVAQDPNVVVTFSIKGCKPSELPEGINRCDPPPSISTEKILPTSTVGFMITPTAAAEIPDDGYNGPVVEATELSTGDGEKVVEETQPLQNLK